MEKLRASMQFGGILSREEITLALESFEKEIYQPGEEFQSMGKTANRFGFVEKGILRIFYCPKDEQEVTRYFVREGQYAVDLESYYSDQPGENTFQAVVYTEIYSINRTAWNRLSEQIPKLYLLSKSLTEATLLNKIKDNDFLQYGTGKEKYLEFLKRYPDLALQVPLQHIASYLQVTPQSLSRIRRELAGKG
jgi:CRP-like cAMP-binding protein